MTIVGLKIGQGPSGNTIIGTMKNNDWNIASNRQHIVNHKIGDQICVKNTSVLACTTETVNHGANYNG